MTGYDLNEPFRLEDFGFVRECIEELLGCRIATVYVRGDLMVAVINEMMVVLSFQAKTFNGHGTVYAGNVPSCRYHGKVLFELMLGYRMSMGAAK